MSKMTNHTEEGIYITSHHYIHSSPGAWLRWSSLGTILLPRAGNINTYVMSPALRFRVNWWMGSGLGILRLRLLGAFASSGLLSCWLVPWSLQQPFLGLLSVEKAAPGRCSPIVYSWTLMSVNSSLYTALCIYRVDFKLILLLLTRYMHTAQYAPQTYTAPYHAHVHSLTTMTSQYTQLHRNLASINIWRHNTHPPLWRHNYGSQ